MGREIRRVPDNWEHPKNEDGRYHPMFDDDFESALKEWLDGYELWKKGEHPDQTADWIEENMPYWEWAGAPPDPDYYHPKFENADWYQVYETVSEGTPVTPPFPTKEELVNYLTQHGDFWDQWRGLGGWSRENAERFVSSQYAPSLAVWHTSEGVEIKTPRDGA